MNIDEISIKMGLLYGNEESEMRVKARRGFTKIMAELLQIKNNIRWCANHYCTCHPESSIKYQLENNEELKLFLIEENIYKDLLNICMDYKPVTVFDMKYV